MTENEFSRFYRGDILRRAPQSLRLAAKSDECAALTRRFGVERLESLTADLRLCPEGKGQILRVNGRLRADVVQTCIVSGDSLTQTMDDDFRLVFRFVSRSARKLKDCPAREPEPFCGDDSGDLPDIEDADPGGIDLGEAIVQQFAVFLDPYPRRDGVQWPGASIDVAPSENDVAPSDSVCAQGSLSVGAQGATTTAQKKQDAPTKRPFDQLRVLKGG